MIGYRGVTSRRPSPAPAVSEMVGSGGQTDRHSQIRDGRVTRQPAGQQTDRRRVFLSVGVRSDRPPDAQANVANFCRCPETAPDNNRQLCGIVLVSIRTSAPSERPLGAYCSSRQLSALGRAATCCYCTGRSLTISRQCHILPVSSPSVAPARSKAPHGEVRV